MNHLIEITSILIACLIFGGMIFFAGFMAPLIFIKLSSETAGKFIREVFPWYYLVFGCLSALLVILLFFNPNKILLYAMLSIFFAFVLAREWLMPKINITRDLALEGDNVASRKFNILHRLSVVVNSMQILGLSTVLYFLIK